jgi:uncharacterized delta-60 repeat protein
MGAHTRISIVVVLAGALGGSGCTALLGDFTANGGDAGSTPAGLADAAGEDGSPPAADAGPGDATLHGDGAASSIDGTAPADGAMPSADGPVPSAEAGGDAGDATTAPGTDGATTSGDGSSGANDTGTTAVPEAATNDDYSTSVLPNGVTLSAGGSAQTTVTVTRTTGFTGSVAVALSGAPAGITADPLTIGSAETSGVLTLHAASSAAPGTATVSVRVTSGSDVASANLSVTISPPPGTIDTNFGTGGIASFTELSGFQPAAVAVQSDDKIVVAGTVTNGSNSYAGVVRFNGDGSLDASFGTLGKNDSVLGQASAVAIDSSGRILIAGRHTANATGAFLVTRYTAAGAVDTTFGSSGSASYQESTLGSGSTALAIAIQSDGKIVAGGWTDGYDGPDNGTVVRFTSAGALDATWGTAGKMDLTPPHGESVKVTALGIQSSGNIIATGGLQVAYGSDPGAVNAFFTYQISAAGVQSVNFVSPEIMPTYYGATAAAIDPTDNVVATGDGEGPMTTERVQSTGGEDIFFASTSSTSGEVTTTISGYDFPVGLVLQHDGKIDVLVSTNGQSLQTDQVALARYTSAGVLDSTFADAGVATNLYNGAPYYAEALGQQSNGQLIIVSARPTPPDAGTVVYTAVLLRVWP